MTTTVEQLRVVVVFEDGTLRHDTWTLTPGRDCLTHLQEAVGGIVDCVGLSPTVDLWVHDEGLYRCAPNPMATALAHALAERDLTTPLFGPAVFTGGVDSTGETLGLTETTAHTLTGWVAWLTATESDTLAEIGDTGRRISEQVR